jgi:polysaccharide biosynthesis protein PslH
MKILMLTPYLPYPLLSGGQIRTYNLLKHLQDKHDITLFSFIRKDEERAYIPELQKFCRQVVVFKRRPAWSLSNIFLAGFSAFPFVMISTYLSKTVRQAIAVAISQERYDVIHAEPFYMMPNIPKTKIPILLVEQTIEYLVYQKYVDDFSFWPLQPLLYLDVIKLRLWEQYFWRRATRLVAMSPQDRHIMLKATQRQKLIDVVANGVDGEFFAQMQPQPAKFPTVLFVGNFKWLPNKDAATFLARDIWPLIKAATPLAKLRIVGANPTPEIKNLSQISDVEVEGEIPDIRQAFTSSQVLLAPIRNGRGTKYKVLEAMASGVPVVTTPLGIDGLDIIPGQHALVATTAAGLADATVRLIRTPSLGAKIAAAAKHLVTQKYNWSIISSNLDRIYQELGHHP